MLIPDKLDDDVCVSRKVGGVLVATNALFLPVEIGRKTQIASVALAAGFDQLAAVVLGTTVGLLPANAPVAFCGETRARRLPVRVDHVIAALVSAAPSAGVLTMG